MSDLESRRRLVAAAADEVRRRAAGPFPRVVLMLGSGLGGIADSIEPEAVIPTAELPGFPRLTAPGHAGCLLIGRAGGVRIACLQGRAHLYEGHDPADIAAPIRTMKALGAEALVMASAAGGLRPDRPPGSLLIVEDHINFAQRNPLTGPNDDGVGPRFPDMTDAYDPGLRAALARAGEGEGVPLAAGVYLHIPGPSFETPAEIRMFARLGADVVGMSTVPECIVARHCGLKVAAVAVVTNFAAGIADGPITLEEAIAAGREASGRLGRLLFRMLSDAFGG